MSDLISRQAAMEALQEKVFHDLSDEFYGALQVLDELPSAVVPVIHAHWIDDGYYADFHPHKVYRCSNCDWSKLDVELPEEKYCPNCGAKMDEEVE